MRLLLLAAAALAASAHAAITPPPNLVVDGAPAVPEAVAERMGRYQNVRGARFQDWDPVRGGMLITTRFAQTAQVHHVGFAGAARTQLTFEPEPVGSASVVRGFGDGFAFRMDRGGNENHQYHWFDRATGRTTLLTDGASRNQSLSVSNASDRIAFVSNRRNGRDFDVYVLARPDATAATLVKVLEGTWAVLDWSRDDSKLLLQNYVSANVSSLHVLDVATGGMREIAPPESLGRPVSNGQAVFARDADAVFLSSDQDSEFQRLVRLDLKTLERDVLTPRARWDVDELAISPDGKWLAWTTNENGASVLRFAPAANAHPGRVVEMPAGIIAGLGFDAQGRTLGFSFSSPRFPGDAWSVSLADPRPVRWTESEVGGLPTASFVQPELVEFPTFDGRRIPAWYYRPVPAPGRGDGPFPVLVDIHGGPESQARPYFDPLVQYWLAELGVAVIEPNVRGSSGYGKSWLLLDNGVRREDSVQDIGALLAWIGTRRELDAQRVAVKGGSYGGYMTLATMARYPDQVRCGIDVVGISNFVTFLESTSEYRRDLRRAEYGDERIPEVRAVLESISPTTLAHRITKPLLVVQGANDPRVPQSEAEQVVRTVRANGTEVWYLLGRDEGHGFAKKENRDHYLQVASLFLETFLLPQSSPDRAPSAVTSALR